MYISYMLLYCRKASRNRWGQGMPGARGASPPCPCGWDFQSTVIGGTLYAAQVIDRCHTPYLSSHLSAAVWRSNRGRWSWSYRRRTRRSRLCWPTRPRGEPPPLRGTRTLPTAALRQRRGVTGGGRAGGGGRGGGGYSRQHTP